MNNQNDRRRRGRIFAILTAAWLTFPAFARVHESGSGRQLTAIPPPEEMERDLLIALNRERAAQSLPLLRLSPALIETARKQSSEMADLSVLSHDSAAGTSFTERLTGAAIAFAAHGENIARSGTFLVDLIHRSFMESPEHRDNILNPEFDEVGIGIIRGAGNTYYVTEDFIKALVPKPISEVGAMILSALNETRAKKRSPPVVLIDEVSRTAEHFARDRAAGREFSPIPAFFGRTSMDFVIGPDLDTIAAKIREKNMDRYGRAGIGILFSRSPEFPGGAYFVCLALIEDAASAGPDELDRLLRVLKAANNTRGGKSLGYLELDHGLSRRADEAISQRRQGTAASRPAQGEGGVLFYMSWQLDRIDDTVRKRLEDPELRRIGISTLPIQLEDGRLLLYAVAVILAR